MSMRCAAMLCTSVSRFSNSEALRTTSQRIPMSMFMIVKAAMKMKRKKKEAKKPGLLREIVHHVRVVWKHAFNDEADERLGHRPELLLSDRRVIGQRAEHEGKDESQAG
mmetsp:Transcript_27461/g.60097  ORF Transcript_27461/g.60097 Transcript_27461/m.60097 type:complete len:109 (+) Transcript_27461:424-750(+)